MALFWLVFYYLSGIGGHSLYSPKVDPVGCSLLRRIKNNWTNRWSGTFFKGMELLLEAERLAPLDTPLRASREPCRWCGFQKSQLKAFVISISSLGNDRKSRHNEAGGDSESLAMIHESRPQCSTNDTAGALMVVPAPAQIDACSYIEYNQLPAAPCKPMQYHLLQYSHAFRSNSSSLSIPPDVHKYNAKHNRVLFGRRARR